MVGENMPPMSVDIMQDWIENPKALKRALSYLDGGLVQSTPSEISQSLIVLPDLSHAERIKRGNYGWTDGGLTEKRFPVTDDQLGEWEWKLFHFDQTISSDKAIRLMKEDGFDPAQTGHILTFGEKYPQEQRKYPIIGLGSEATVSGDRRVPGLWGDGGRRKLGLGWFDDGWFDRCRFLGVRKPSESSGA
jgi:hypothetical protein